ncbi:hypothetical protein [Halopseudomonas pelagia]|uniref:hypothetical protein n=1 Tax=Halopseudomonas pelagia TaxID=553151 RepID=UPI0003A59C2C|nr:hypothetical protein [Halopseudomonas pelagia]|tara:strand:- start:77 stop:979 length:903 start_codon:yes stop_codon:yes gene_type:complete
MKGRDLDDDLPSFRATDDHEPVAENDQEPYRSDTGAETIRGPLRPEPAAQGNGALWALCAALTLALIGFGYWSHQQQTQLRQQLVATQNSFARISEDAAGRIQDITGKVSATESSRSEAEQARTAQLQRLEKQLGELTKQVQSQAASLETARASERALLARLDQQEASADTAAQQLASQGEQLSALDQRASDARSAATELEKTLNALNGEVGQLTQLEQQLKRQEARTASLESKFEILAANRQAVNLDQELLVLRSEIDQRLSTTQDALESIDSFRVQVNRNINTLQTQLTNLQRQVSTP